MKTLQTPTADIAYREHDNFPSDTCLIFMSGFMGTAIYADVQSHIQYFAEQGYYTIAFDAPDIWASTGTYTPYNCIQTLDDIVQEKCLGYENIYIIGHSMGGLIAMYYAMKHDYISGGAALMSPLYIGENQKWKDDGIRTGTREIPGTDGETLEYALPYSFHKELIDISNLVLDGLSTYSKSTFFISGSDDEIVTSDVVKQNLDICIEPKKLYELSCGHDYRDDENVISEMEECIERFLI